MAPVPKGQLLVTASERLTEAARKLNSDPKADVKLWLSVVHGQLLQVDEVRRWARFTSENAYNNFPGLRTHLFNVSLMLEEVVEHLRDYHSLLLESPHDQDILIKLAIIAQQLKSIRMSPKPKSQVPDEAEETSPEEEALKDV
jgi:hypothetical protein